MPARFSGERPWRRTRYVHLGDTPAAGADWSVTVPAGRLWELVSAYATLVTSATVADRAATLSLGDGVDPYLVLPPAAVQAASATVGYAWVQHGAALAVGTSQEVPLPRLFLLPGWTVAAVTANLQAGDQWAAPRLLVVETMVKAGPIDLGELPDLYVAMSP